MKSGVVKQKWTPEEEAALRAGVEKYGAGKWRAIQKDADYGACLISRSNVDLKDKWRNMSVSANGLGSREKAARILAAKMKQVGTTQSQGEMGSEMKVANAPAVASKDRKLQGARFDHLILEAVTNLKDSNGGSKGQIASYLESRYPVPSNFKRLLAAKLKFLIQQGKLMKMRRNYSMTPDTFRIVEERPGEEYSEESAGDKQPLVHLERQASEEAALRHKSMAAEEAARRAAQAVADAEAAAAAAEEAARVAEIAEAEWEAAEAAAEMAAALASGSSRSFNIISSVQGGFAVPA